MCGIVGMVSRTGVSHDIYSALLVLQHRGQDAAGIATYHDGKFRLRKSRAWFATSSMPATWSS